MSEFLRQEYQLNANELAEILKISPQGVYQRLKKDQIGEKLPGKGFVVSSPDVRKIFESKDITYDHHTISFQCAKGGVGKTSLAYSLGIRANMYGAKVLMIDLDMQGHLTLGFVNEENSQSLVSEDVPVWLDMIEGQVGIEDIIKPITSTLHLIPSNLNNADLENVLSKRYKQFPIESSVRKFLDPIKDNYDYIIIDCAPGFSGINTGALCASDLVIVPAAPDRYGVDGVSKTMTELEELIQSWNLQCELKILLNRYDARKKICVNQLQTLMTKYPKQMFSCYIRENSEIANATEQGLSVFELPRKNTPAKEDLDVLTRDVLGLRE